MTPIAFVSSFVGAGLSRARPGAVSARSPSRAPSHRCRARMASQPEPAADLASVLRAAKSRRVVGIVGKAASDAAKTKAGTEAAPARGGIFGMKAQAYWDSIGVLPLAFAGFGVVALAIKMLKVKGGELRSGPSGVNKVTIPKTAITTVEEEAELHVFKCGGCGYEMYPARGREFKFFPDSFKCPLCGTPKSEFWDLNDPDDPRNQEEEEEEADQDDDGGVVVGKDEPSEGGGGANIDRAERDSS